MGVSIRADEMSAAGPSRSRRREAMVVLGHRFIEVGTEAESRLIGVRKRRNPHPDAARAATTSRSRPIKPPANRRLGIPRHPLGNREAAERPGSARRAMIDQGRERIESFAAPEIVDVDQDVLRAQAADESSSAKRPDYRKARTGPPRNDSG